MCGIAGIVMRDGAARRGGAGPAGRRMAHRGPDGSGAAGPVALVSTRLAIIDLVTGDQPLFAGAAALVGNGEIYNYRELRAAMPGVHFATNSDCEPPLHLWLRDGADYAQRTARHVRHRHPRTRPRAGDADARSVRHQAAVHRADRAGLAFASEPQALLQAGLVGRGRCARARARELLQLQFTTGAERSSRASSACCPARPCRARRRPCAGRRAPRRTAGRRPDERRRRGAARGWTRVLEESVDLHQRSDVPYGMFLSGGIDRSVLCADGAAEQPAGAGVHRRLRRQRRRGRDRAGRAVAKAVGADHEASR